MRTFHIIAILAIVGLELAVPTLWSQIFERVRRPELVARGAKPCSLLPLGIPEIDECDVFLASSQSGIDKIIAYAEGGRRKTTVILVEGQFQSSRTEHWLNCLPRRICGSFLIEAAAAVAVGGVGNAADVWAAFSTP
ncbi:MAG: hypothetical protein ACYC9N_22775, partial [Thermoanaerobaculia bacterium]